MTPARSTAIRMIRSWTRLYTRGLPADECDRRRLELESDVWEHLYDSGEVAAGRALLGRTLRGIPADVRWRYRTLLDSRGARHRSHDMTTRQKIQWWTPTTMVIGLATTVLAIIGIGFGDTESGAWVMALGWLIGAALMLGGLATLRSRPVRGSRLVIAGAVLLAMGEPIAIPLAVVVILGGLWTGNLVTTEQQVRPRPLSDRQASLSEQWLRWLTAAVVLGGLGFLVLLVWPAVTPDDCTETNPCWEDTAAWATWILSWMAAIITGGVGLILAASRFVVRHRTRPA